MRKRGMGYDSPVSRANDGDTIQRHDSLALLPKRLFTNYDVGMPVKMKL